MTQFFLAKFKNANKCNACKQDKLSGYSLCPDHLLKARVRFMNWANERRALALCISCNRKSRLCTRGEFKGVRHEIRCSMHARLNREKLKRWFALHPTYSSDAWKKQVEMRNAGKCSKCPEHRALETGFRACKLCRIKARFGYKAMRRAEAEMALAASFGAEA